MNEVVRAAIEEMKGAGAEFVQLSLPNLAEEIAGTSLYLSRSRNDIDTFLQSRPALAHSSLREVYATGTCHKNLDLIQLLATVSPEKPEDDPEYFAKVGGQPRPLPPTPVGALERVSQSVWGRLASPPPRQGGARHGLPAHPRRADVAEWDNRRRSRLLEQPIGLLERALEDLLVLHEILADVVDVEARHLPRRTWVQQECAAGVEGAENVYLGIKGRAQDAVLVRHGIFCQASWSSSS